MTTLNSNHNPVRCTVARWFRRIADRLAPQQSDLVERIKPFVS